MVRIIRHFVAPGVHAGDWQPPLTYAMLTSALLSAYGPSDGLWDGAAGLVWARRSEAVITQQDAERHLDRLREWGLLPGIREAFAALAESLEAAYPDLAAVGRPTLYQLIALGQTGARAALDTQAAFEAAKNELQPVDLAALLSSGGQAAPRA